ncbi:Smr/MutS family protein [Chitinivibrio alkaliphilus]|nr:Smr/MutS family protein [Chitinivibrio alkaliphilus]
MSLRPEQAAILEYVEQKGFLGAEKEEFYVHNSPRTKSSVYRKGRAMEQRLDLHGKSWEEARKAVADLFATARNDGVTQVLLIHGRGNHGSDVLRQRLRQSFDTDWAHRVDSYKYVSGAEGGDGATRVFLQ